MEYTPDKWVIICIIPDNEDDPPLYKVFATWSGGYLDADCWRLNSGILGITEDENSYSFHGYSGSEYVCGKNSYGTTVYGAGVLKNLLDKTQGYVGYNVFVLCEEDAMKYIENKLKENK